MSSLSNVSSSVNDAVLSSATDNIPSVAAMNSLISPRSMPLQCALHFGTHLWRFTSDNFVINRLPVESQLVEASPALTVFPMKLCGYCFVS